MLLGQHADVTVELGGISILDWACLAGDWEMIELLLLHGAHPRTGRLGEHKADKERFERLVEETDRRQGRPPRPCPCWSGKALAECHAAAPQAYPPAYSCPCGSGRCCLKRGVEYTEQWDEGEQRIRSRRKGEVDVGTEAEDPAGDVTSLIESMQQMSVKKGPHGAGRSGRVDPREAERIYTAAIARCVKDALVPKGLVDPAFVYAMPKAGFCPMPGAKMNSERARI